MQFYTPRYGVTPGTLESKTLLSFIPCTTINGIPVFDDDYQLVWSSLSLRFYQLRLIAPMSSDEILIVLNKSLFFNEGLYSVKISSLWEYYFRNNEEIISI